MSKKKDLSFTKRIINNEILDNGLPCHKYILRKLSNIVDATTFTKTYVNTMIIAGATYYEIETALPLLTLKLKSDSPIAGYDFLKHIEKKPAFSLVDSIRFDENIPTYKTCGQFYKKFENKCYACMVCPLSKKYLNGLLQDERTVISYALSSLENWNYVAGKGVLSSHFKSVFDVLSFFSFAEKPCCYPLFSKTYEALQDGDVRKNFFSRDIISSFGDELLLYHDSVLSNGYIPRGLMSAELMMQLGEVLAEEVIVKNVPSLDVVNNAITSLLNQDSEKEDFGNPDSNKKNKKDTAIIAESSNMGVSTIVDFYDSLKDNPAAGVDNGTLYKEITLLDVMEQYSFLESFDEEELDLTLEQDVFKEESVADSVNEDTMPECGSMENTVISEVIDEETVSASVGQIEKTGRNLPAIQPSRKLRYQKLSFAEREILIKEIDNLSEDGKRVYRELKDKSMCSIPIVPMEELSKFALSLDSQNIRLLAMFESYILKDRAIGTELIVNENHVPYLLFYSKKLHAYFYTNMRHPNIVSILTPLLSQPSIKKYCYYPFPLLSVLFKKGIYVKGVESLFAMSSLLFGDHQMDMSMALQKMGAVQAVGGVTIKPEGRICSIPLSYMHSYHNIHRRGINKLTALGLMNEYIDRNHFDTILGYSYYQNSFIENGQVLFFILSANRYRFSKITDCNFLQQADCLTYKFTDIPLKTPYLVRALLRAYESAGYFRKYNIGILSVGISSFSLYVKKEYRRHVLTTLNSTFLAYMCDNNLSGIEYTVDG